MRVTSTDGVELEVHDLGGEGRPVLVAHATGFCAGAYRPFADRLATHGFHVWGVDFRGHGASTTPADGDVSWTGMAQDVLAVLDALADQPDGAPRLAFGHSMGGASLAAAELERPGLWDRTVLFEPIIVPGAWEGTAGRNPMSEAARRRRPGFASRAAALARYASRPPLGAFRADVLFHYVESGFAEEADGSVSLRCRPEVEAAVFEATGKPTIPQMVDFHPPTLVTRGERDPFGPGDFARHVAEAMPGGRLRSYAHVGHFGPFQDPDTLADDAAAFFTSRLATDFTGAP